MIRRDGSLTYLGLHTVAKKDSDKNGNAEVEKGSFERHVDRSRGNLVR